MVPRRAFWNRRMNTRAIIDCGERRLHLAETKQPATALSAKQVTQLAKEAAKTPTPQSVKGVTATGGTVHLRDGKPVVKSD